MAEVWDKENAPDADTEALIFAAEDVVERWRAYRQARFGNTEGVKA